MPMPSFLTAGQDTAGGSGWEPTVVYLLLLVLAEIVLFGLIARVLR